MKRLASMPGPAIRRGRSLVLTAIACLGAAVACGQDRDVAVMEQTPRPHAVAADLAVRPGIGSVWSNGDLVARASLLALLVMAAGSAYVIASRFWEQSLLLRHAETVGSRFWSAPNLYQAVQNLERRSAFRKIAEDGLEAAAHREGRLTDSVAPEEWIDLSLARSVARAGERLGRGLAALPAVATSAPIVGLAGTVWGVCQACFATAAGAAPGRSTAALLGEALMITVLGLAVAVPASLGHHWLTQRNAAAIGRLRDFAADMRAVLHSTDAALTAETARLPRT